MGIKYVGGAGMPAAGRRSDHRDTGGHRDTGAGRGQGQTGGTYRPRAVRWCSRVPREPYLPPTRCRAGPGSAAGGCTAVGPDVLVPRQARPSGLYHLDGRPRSLHRVSPLRAILSSRRSRPRRKAQVGLAGLLLREAPDPAHPRPRRGRAERPGSRSPPLARKCFAVFSTRPIRQSIATYLTYSAHMWVYWCLSQKWGRREHQA